MSFMMILWISKPEKETLIKGNKTSTSKTEKGKSTGAISACALGGELWDYGDRQVP